MMKTTLGAAAVLAPAAAFAHDAAGVAHFHPHPHPAFLVGVVAIVGVVALVTMARDR